MKVTGSTEVYINPIDVIEELYREKINNKEWIFEENGKYYKGYEVGSSPYSIAIQFIEINEKEFNYIKSLKNILNYHKVKI